MLNMRSSRKGLRITLGVSLLLALLMAVSSVGMALTAPGKFVSGRQGIVAAADPLAAMAGLEMLRKGGNAVDAAVASAFAVGVVEPQASSIGGEGMMVIYLAKEDKSTVIDYKSAIPAAAESLGDKRAPSKGYGSVGIPGTVAGLALALEKYGTMSLAEVLEPAIRLADKGFPCGKTLASVVNDNFATISSSPELSKVFLKDGLPVVEGDIVRNVDYANSLRLIAKYGPDAFYKGAIADAIASEMALNGGFLSKEDLAQYKALESSPIRSTYRGYSIITTPPPVTSVALLTAINVMKQFDMAARSNLSFENIHVISEAIRQANIDRRQYVGDPAFVKVPIQGLLSEEYAKSIAGKISFDKVRDAKTLVPGVFNVQTGMGFTNLAATGTEGPAHDTPSTTQISVVDRKHNLVSLTQTVSSFFGAGVMIKGTGIILNNEMGNVYGPKESPTGLQAHKRIVTTISPSVVLKNGKPYMAIGTPGASRIMTTMAILFSNILDHNMPLDKAIDAPRFHPSETKNMIEVEGRMPVGVVERLKAAGYEVVVHPDYDLYFGGVQGVMIDDRGVMYGGADPRRDGAAAAY